MAQFPVIFIMHKEWELNPDNMQSSPSIQAMHFIFIMICYSFFFLLAATTHYVCKA